MLARAFSLLPFMRLCNALNVNSGFRCQQVQSIQFKLQLHPAIVWNFRRMVVGMKQIYVTHVLHSNRDHDGVFFFVCVAFLFYIVV